ncbi:MAG TPA: Flp pilus assembly protein CpaB [Devosia sp.]|nr:Flp pilus assembly protein CpaB [Devosia sp.]
MSRILLLLVALLAGGLAAYLATRGGDVPGDPAVAEPEVIEEARTQVLVATAPIGVGERLSEANMVWQDWPENAVREDYISQAAMPDALTEMVGVVARFEIFEGDPIRQQKLVRAEQGYLSAVLDKGKRGVSIPVQADSASGGFIVPNDHVDVILTRAGASGQMSETILSNVRVLAIGTRLGEVGTTGGPADPENPRAEVFADSAIATLELDPAQAETVINARQLGQLSLALRSIVDFDQTAQDAVRRNAPIRVIRYGVEANVITGTTPTSTTGDVDVTAEPVTYAPPMRGTVSEEPAEVLE